MCPLSRCPGTLVPMRKCGTRIWAIEHIYNGFESLFPIMNYKSHEHLSGAVPLLQKQQNPSFELWSTDLGKFLDILSIPWSPLFVWAICGNSLVTTLILNLPTKYFTFKLNFISIKDFISDVMSCSGGRSLWKSYFRTFCQLGFFRSQRGVHRPYIGKVPSISLDLRRTRPWSTVRTSRMQQLAPWRRQSVVPPSIGRSLSAPTSATNMHQQPEQKRCWTRGGGRMIPHRFQISSSRSWSWGSCSSDVDTTWHLRM